LKRARLLGTVVFGAVVALLTTVFSVQIIQQAWSTGTSRPAADCHEGLRSLLSALERARQSAARHTGELEASAAFRSALAETWETEGALHQACASEPLALDLLRRIHTLRYAEEQAARRDAAELTRARVDVQQLASKLPGLY
jgi:hypothetical protein